MPIDEAGAAGAENRHGDIPFFHQRHPREAALVAPGEIAGKQRSWSNLGIGDRGELLQFGKSLDNKLVLLDFKSRRMQNLSLQNTSL